MDENVLEIIWAFARLYIFAVIVERFIEFFSLSESQVLCLFNNKAKIENKKRIIENRQKLITGITSLSKESTIKNRDSMEELKSEIKKLEEEIRKHENEKRKEEKKRICNLWAIGFILSIVICGILNCFGLKLMEPFFDFKCFDWLVSSLFISSGTKPLHDIITILEKAKPTK